MGAGAEVFLGDLQFERERRARHGAEERMKRLARLEVDRAVLDLHHHVGAELAVERLELVVGLLGPVVRDVLVVDEGAPHHDAAVRRERIGQQVGAVGVGAAVVLRPGLALRVGLDEEAAEIGNEPVDLVRPCPSTTPSRPGSSGSAVFRPPISIGRAEAGREINADAVGPENVGQHDRLAEIGVRQDERIGVHVGQHGAVDADGGVGAGVVAVARID